MSASDDISGNKDEDELLKEDLDNVNRETPSEGKNIPIIETSDKAVDSSSISAVAGDNTVKSITAGSNNQTMGEKTDNMDKNAIDDIEKSPLDSDKGSGDTVEVATTSKQGNDPITDTEVPLEGHSKQTTESEPLSIEKAEKEVKASTETVTDDEIDDDDLQLRWEDDDGLNLSMESKKDSVSPDKNEPKSPDNKVKSGETPVDKTPVDDSPANETPADKESPAVESETTATAKDTVATDAEIILEEKLLEEDDVDSVETSKMPEADVPMDEDELLRDVAEESCMDVDISDQNVNKDVKIASDTADNTNKVQEDSLETDKCTQEDMKDEPHLPLQAEKQVDAEDTNIKDVDSITESENTPEKEDNILQDSPPVINMQEEDEMEIENTNLSIETSPIHVKHGIHKPDVMLEIPTQELIDIDDELSPDDSKIDDDVPNDDCNEIDGKFEDCNEDEEKFDDNEIVRDSRMKEDTPDAVVSEKTDDNSICNEIPVESPKESISQADDAIKEKDLTVEEKPGPSKAPTMDEAQPSTSAAPTQMTPDASDEVPDMSDSLGLLAESRRVVDEDEEQDDEDDGEQDEDEDSDIDESSNQMTAEHSEDSNPQHSETEPAKDEQEKETEFNAEEKDDMFNQCEEDFEYTLNNVGTEVQTDDNDKIEMQEEVKEKGMMTEELNAEELPTDGLKPEAASGQNDNEQPLPDIITSSVSDMKVKDEKSDGAQVSGTDTKRLKQAVKTTSVEKEIISRQTSTTSNDDVIEQIEEIETVKLSDDEDEPPPQNDQLPPEDHDGDKDTPVEQTTENTAVDQVKPAEETKSASEPEKPSPKSSPSKLKDLTISSVNSANVLNIVELEESSSEDDIQVVHKCPHLKQLLESNKPLEHATPSGADVTSVNLPPGIEIMSTSGGSTSEIVVKEGELVISGVPKPPPLKPARLNTSEVTIKTASSAEQTLVIPEAKINEQAQAESKSQPKLSLEIFNLDSDEEDTTTDKADPPPEPEDPKDLKKKRKKCINSACTSGAWQFLSADAATAAYYDASRKRRPMVCRPCAAALRDRQQGLVSGIRNMTPLLQLDMTSSSQDLVEILDSDSEDEDPQTHTDKEPIGEEAAEFIEKNLAEILNKAWMKHNLDERLKDTQDELNAEMSKLERESAEIDAMLSECQRVTDRLRTDLYATFQHRLQELPAILIYETPEFNYIGPEIDNVVPLAVADSAPRLRNSNKRKASSVSDVAPKRPAIPLGYAPLDANNSQEPKAVEDDKDISVVKLSAEAAPADLPAAGELVRAPLRVGMAVYAMKNAFGPWFKGKILDILPKSHNSPFTNCRIKFDHKVKNSGKVLPARCIAYAEPANVRLTIGTRLVALFKDSNKKESYYSGIVAEIPNPVNNYRYLVFFDDGYAQYVSHAHTRVVCECSPLVWEEVHPFSREFVREYLMAYPSRPMVRLHEGQFLKTEWDGKWWSSRVLKVDASLAQVVFTGDGRREWVYRGSTRLAPLYLELRAAERHRPRPVPRSKHARSDMPYVEYTRSDEPGAAPAHAHADNKPSPPSVTQQQQNEEIRRQRAVAKKSTAIPAQAPPAAPANANLDTVTSRVVYYTPKNAVKPYKLVPHKCSPKCKRSDVLSLKDLRTYNPLAKPLLSGWERQIVRFKGNKEVMYRAPCGRRLRSMRELHRYLRLTASDLPVDLFDFYHATHCLAEFVLNKCLVGKKDLSHGKENVPVPCVNYYDDSLPEFCSYNTERTPTSGVPLNLDPEFLCGCDCTDDCEDKSKCACWQLTLEGARTIGLEGQSVGYEYKRLPEPLSSGIYECNSRCKCKDTCLNRVAQHPLQLKLQVFKTVNRGWGIRALNDVPKGSFLCVYAGNLLTDATANLDGLNEGDEYLAELDYIEVVEQMKEGYEEDIPEADKKIAKKESGKEESPAESSSSSEEDETGSKTDKEDDDFRPGYIGLGVMEFNKRLRKRGKKDKDTIKTETDKEKDVKPEIKPATGDEECITISDDDEVREPARLGARPGMVGGEFVPKYKSVRALFGEDEACYIMDAKVQGNIGRYLNHSCSPNVFVQNVFVDTHDPRFPWVAFFALSHIKAGTELTWNYNYDVGSVPGKVLYCHCEAPNCRGRLL